MAAAVKVSVVIPAYNAEAFLRRTLDSVFAQTLPGVEILVVDDGSADGTAGVAASAGPAVTVVRGERRGVSAARNEGIRRSRGEYVAFMDHDDLWHPEKLAKQAAILEEDDRAGLVFTQAVVEEAGVVREIFPRIDQPAEFLSAAYENLVHWNYIPMSAVMVRRRLLEELTDPSGPFDPAFSLAEDWDLWLRLAARMGEGGVRYIAEPLTRYMILAGRATERMADLRLEDLRIFDRETREHPWLAASAPGRCRDTRHRLLQEAGYWLLREGRRAEARRVLGEAWRARPWSLKPLAWMAASIARPSGHT